MKNKLNKVTLLIAALFSVQAFAESYIVLFKQGSLPDGRDREALEIAMQEQNRGNIAKLLDWARQTGNGRPSKAEDLWLIQGAVADLEADDVVKLKAEPYVASVIKNKTRKYLHTQPDLTIIKNPFGTHNQGLDLWGHEAIKLKEARAAFPALTGKGMRVGILDTGIQSKHPEFSKTGGIFFKDFINGLENAYDDHGHGTHVAGTIAGTNTGIAPQATLYMAKIFPVSGGGEDATIIKAMQWMFDPDGNPKTNDQPTLVSNSWGAELDGIVNGFEEFEGLHRAVMAWIKVDILPIFAAGNSGGRPNGIPGGFPDSLSVGATQSDGALASFSSRGPNVWKHGGHLMSFVKPDVCAPGHKIASALPGNTYASWSGTSMATPHVSGALTLMRQLNPSIKYGKVKELLMKSLGVSKKSHVNVDLDCGFGKLDLLNLLNAAAK